MCIFLATWMTVGHFQVPNSCGTSALHVGPIASLRSWGNGPPLPMVVAPGKSGVGVKARVKAKAYATLQCAIYTGEWECKLCAVHIERGRLTLTRRHRIQIVMLLLLLLLILTVGLNRVRRRDVTRITSSVTIAITITVPRLNVRAS